MRASYNIGLIRGDGIGPEVVREGIKVLERVASGYDFKLDWHDFPISAETYLKRGVLMTDQELDDLSKSAAIYFGAMGDPRVPEKVLQGGGILRLRFHFDQYINLRPAKLYRGVETPLKDKRPGQIDFQVVRENSEDFYVGLGGRFRGSEHDFHLDLKRRLYEAQFSVNAKVEPDEELGFQMGVMSGTGAERVLRYGFELARRKGAKRVTVVDKFNVLSDIYGVWRDRADLVAKDYPEIQYEFAFVDAVTQWFVRRPEWYQIVIAPNTFGDIITDLAAAVVGGMGIAPGGNINPERKYPSMFEPIHGSAPKYAGQKVANPVATILAGAMMLEFLGEGKAAKTVEEAVEFVLAEGKYRTYDLGGSSKTNEVGDAVAAAVDRMAGK
ncbi:MAG: isocitrate/isopropylmalate dehydrogenase family protein [Chloroflexi bacterium]|nr:isocitrate/isopropylmalate dehydrogenase family protein [Chloroflexota bacterium]MCL5109667.1 isocitrate/isopropylmalate dehydrogenase family protein [Chloroflexota bacterium]